MKFDRDKERKAGAAYSIAMNVFVMIFGIFWCIMAASMGAGFMLIFGIPFVGMAAYRLVMCVKLAKNEQEKKSTDPWDRPAGQQSYQNQPPHQNPASGSGYCPYCGASTSAGFQFCPTCGRKLPE